jgi:DNA polymerase IV
MFGNILILKEGVFMERVILHSDLNNFYASVECLYNPELRDKPVAVCGSQSTRHGIVLAKNGIAKSFGVKAGDAVWEAKGKCPGLIVVKPNYMQYLKFSMLTRDIYRYYTDRIEAFGIDENWLDVTESTKLFGSGEKIAYEIKKKVKFELGVSVSIGVGKNRVISKIASELKKPDAVTVITDENFKGRIWSLPVEDMLYVGPSTKKKLNKVAIFTIGDLANVSPDFLIKLLGVWGQTLWLFANGYDDTPVSKLEYEPIIKGIGNSLTTPRDLVCDEDINILSYVLAESVGERLRRHRLKGRTVQIWVRDSELASIERQAKLSRYTDATSEIAEKANEIFKGSWNWGKKIRSYGIRVTDLVTADEYIQLSFLTDEHIKRELIDRSIDSIRTRFGHYSIQRAVLLRDRSLNANPVEENVIHPVPFFR